jgi:hypothetical protein
LRGSFFSVGKSGAGRLAAEKRKRPARLQRRPQVLLRTVCVRSPGAFCKEGIKGLGGRGVSILKKNAETSNTEAHSME